MNKSKNKISKVNEENSNSEDENNHIIDYQKIEETKKEIEDDLNESDKVNLEPKQDLKKENDEHENHELQISPPEVNKDDKIDKKQNVDTFGDFNSHMQFKKDEKCKIQNQNSRPKISNNTESIQQSLMYKFINEENQKNYLIRLQNNHIFDLFYIDNDNFKLVEKSDYEEVQDDNFCRIKSIIVKQIQDNKQNFSSPTDSLKNDIMNNKIKKFTFKDHLKHQLDDPKFQASFIKLNIEKQEDIPYKNVINLYANIGKTVLKENVILFKQQIIIIKYQQFELNNLSKYKNLVVAEIDNLPSQIYLKLSDHQSNIHLKNFELQQNKIIYNPKIEIHKVQTNIDLSIEAYDSETNMLVGYEDLRFKFTHTTVEQEIKDAFLKKEKELEHTLSNLQLMNQSLISVIQQYKINNSTPQIITDDNLDSPILKVSCQDQKGNPINSQVLLDEANRLLFTLQDQNIQRNQSFEQFKKHFAKLFSQSIINDETNYLTIKITCISSNYKSAEQTIKLKMIDNEAFNELPVAESESISIPDADENKSTSQNPDSPQLELNNSNISTSWHQKSTCQIKCIGQPCEPNCQKICTKNMCKPKCHLSEAKCSRQCFTPKCTLECPKVMDQFALKRGEFPKCSISCHKPICSLHCSMPTPKCVTHCVEADCNLQCNHNHCGQPLCRLVCDHKPEVECCSCGNQRDWEVKECCPCNLDQQFKLHDCVQGEGRLKMEKLGGLKGLGGGGKGEDRVHCKLVDSHQ